VVAHGPHPTLLAGQAHVSYNTTVALLTVGVHMIYRNGEQVFAFLPEQKLFLVPRRQPIACTGCS